MDQASNLRAAYRILEDRVGGALRTRIGDSQRLSVMRNDALAFMAVIGNVRHQARKTVTALDIPPVEAAKPFSRGGT